MRKAHGLSALLFITFIIGAAGCGDSARLAAEITGTWTRMVHGEEGSFEGYLTFGPGSTFTFTFNGNVRGHEKSEGKYRLSGRDITFKDSSCGGAGKYRFLIKDGVLSFIPLGDGCVRRKALLMGEWKKVGG